MKEKTVFQVSEAAKAKAKLLNRWFTLIGHGNFDLYSDEQGYIIDLLTSLDGEELESRLEDLYVRLSRVRLGAFASEEF